MSGAPSHTSFLYLLQVLGQVTGYGLLTLEGNEHRSLRRFINPAFGVQHLKAQHEQFYYEAINRLVDEFRKQINEQEKPEGGKVIDLYEWSGRCLLDIIGSSAFGLDVDCVRNADSPLSVAYHNLVSEYFRSVSLLKIPFHLTLIGLFLLRPSERFQSSHFDCHSLPSFRLRYSIGLLSQFKTLGWTNAC